MNTEKFWDIINASLICETAEEQRQWILQELVTKSKEEIEGYQRIQEKIGNQLHSNIGIREEAENLNLQLSADGFWYFSYWLISKGKNVYKRVFYYPETLGEILRTYNEKYPENELFMYIGYDAYKYVTGEEPI